MNMKIVIFLSLYFEINLHPSKNLSIQVFNVLSDECKHCFETFLFLNGQSNGVLVLQVLCLVVNTFSLEVIFKSIL